MKAHPLPIKFIGLSSESSNEKSEKLKSPLVDLDDFWEGEKRFRDEEATENKYKERLETLSCIAAAGMSL